MNYLLQIRGFWMLHQQHSFSANEIALYLHLLEVANLCAWRNPFKRSNAKLQADLNLTYRAVRVARERLQQEGLILAQSQNGVANVTYHLAAFQRSNVGLRLQPITTATKPSPPEVSKAADSSREFAPQRLPFTSTTFRKLWEQLQQSPPWRSKTPESLQAALQLLGSYHEEFAISLMQKSLAGEWKSIAFADTDYHYQQWKTLKRTTHEHANLPVNHKRYGESTL